jgi:predicted metalloprotease
MRVRAGLRLLVAGLALALTTTACTALTVGRGSPGLGSTAPNAHLDVIGSNGSAFDQTAENSISDVLAFWQKTFPQISGGTAFPPLKGGLYSVDGATLTPQQRQEGCLRQDPTAAVDNAFYCFDDDSVVWDRNPKHLVPMLGQKYGTLLVAAVFAHEFGLVIQGRLNIAQRNIPTIFVESQADCAAGAFLATVIKGQAPHFRATQADLENVLVGYLNVRDPTPTSLAAVSQSDSHGDGFDRLTAVADGIQNGATYCYNSNYFTRRFTERPYTSDTDYQQGGNEPFEQVVDPSPSNPNGGGGGGLQPSLNAFWTAAAKSINKSWKDVGTKQASSPPCASDSGRKFAYCPGDNTTYYETAFARSAYNSLPDIKIDKKTADVTLVDNAPADYALGTLFVFAWGMAVRHQLAGAPLDDAAALIAASCYAGAYSASINGENEGFALSPPDMDEATLSVIKLVPDSKAFGSRGTTGLQRIQAFSKGYFGGLSVC